MVFEHYVILSSTLKVRPLVTLGPRYISVPIFQVQTSSVRTIPFPYFCQERLSLKCYHTSIEYCFIYFTRKPIAIHNSTETDRTEILTSLLISRILQNHGLYETIMMMRGSYSHMNRLGFFFYLMYINNSFETFTYPFTINSLIY